MSPTSVFTQGTIENLQPLANSANASSMKAYLKNQFEFLGIKMQERRKVFKEYLKANKIATIEDVETVVSEFWQLEEREYQYCAIELLAAFKKLWNREIITLFEYCITHKSWWDTVDFIAAECLGPYFKKFPDQIPSVTGRWNNSANMWLQRSSLLFQKAYKTETDVELLSKYILNLAASKEFFIQKAIGWMLREYAKTNPDWVKNFVSDNALAPLSKREAMKHLQ